MIFLKLFLRVKLIEHHLTADMMIKLLFTEERSKRSYKM
jgi:hypothetical protein